MINRFLTGFSLLAFLAIGSLPAQAQSPSTTPAKPTAKPAPTNQPSAKPAPTAPASQTPDTKPAATATKDVSADELKKFASAVKQMLTIARDAETQMTQAVQKTGLNESRFNEIYIAKKDPAAKLATQVTPKEEQSYSQAVAQLATIQKDAQVKMDSVVKSEGLALDRFNQIFAAVQGNPQLRQEVQKLIRN